MGTGTTSPTPGSATISMLRTDLDINTFIDAIGDEIAVLDSRGRIVAVNEAWRAFCRQNAGDSETYYVGYNYLRTTRYSTGPSSAEASIVADGLTGILDGDPLFRCEYPCDSPTEKRWFEIMASPLDYSGGRHIIVQHRNITTRHLERLATEEAHLRAETLAALVASTSDAILSYDLDGNIVTWNRAAQRLYGYTAEEAVGQSLEILYPPNWPKRVTEYRDEIIAGSLRSFEAIRVAKDGSERNVWITCAPIRSPDGGIHSISNVHRDVTEIRRAEQAREIIAQEVIHRAKNMLAVVTSIHRQTARSANSLEEFAKIFGGRIEALARSTDLLVSGNWTTVPLDNLIDTQLRPFRARTIAALSWKGPRVLLHPEAVQVVGMAMHELATNSAKHGVLSRNSGSVEIGWEYRSANSSQDLWINWSETCVEGSITPTNGGFGRMVLTELPKTMLDADPSYGIADNVLHWCLSISDRHYLRAN